VVVIAYAELTANCPVAVDVAGPGQVLTVETVNGNSLFVSNGKPGWLDDKNVIPLNRQAIDRLTAMIKADPKNSWLYNGRATVRSALGELDAAITDFNEAIRLDPQAPAFFSNRGLAYHAQGAFDKAILDYGVAIRLDPNFAFAYFDRAWAWNIIGEYEKAIKDCDQAIRLDPKHSASYFNRSVAMMMLRRPDAAEGFQDFIDMEGWKGPYSAQAAILGILAARMTKDERRADFILDAAANNLGEAWPAPVVSFLRGKMDEQALLALATDNDRRTLARCYLGLDSLLHGRTEQAKSHFQWVNQHGTKNFDEYGIALGELKRLTAEGVSTDR
jgi:tetratricopeptide (TPR) repeat protein